MHRQVSACSVPVHHVIRVLPAGSGYHGRKTVSASRMGVGRGRDVGLRWSALLSSLKEDALPSLFATMDRVKGRDSGTFAHACIEYALQEPVR
jgi:hypothetical protein